MPCEKDSALKMEEGGNKPRNAGRLSMLEKARKQFLP